MSIIRQNGILGPTPNTADPRMRLPIISFKVSSIESCVIASKHCAQLRSLATTWEPQEVGERERPLVSFDLLR